MEFTQETIAEGWLLIGLACLPFSLVNHWFFRGILCTAFLAFAIVSTFRPSEIGSDTSNYLLHAQAYCVAPASINSWFSGNFEPGYNALIHGITRFSCEPRLILLTLALVTWLIWVCSFLIFRVHPAIMMLIFSGVTLVGSIAALRHYLAMAMIFYIVFRREFKGNTGNWPYYFLPPLIHYSTIPAVILLATGDLYRSKGSKILPLFIVSLLVLALIFRFDFIESLLVHAADRISGDSGSTGLRNLMAFVLVFLTLVDFDKFRIRISKLNFEIWGALAACVILLFFPGLNRMSGFFWLICLGFFASEMRRRSQIFPAIIVIFLLNFGSLFFFFRKFS